ncbi:hypothetical protein BGZ95_007009 [Linnemannia exigua]|uniref:Amino acid transporter transmembrane domain-containing protein n=1 Tax=Linnemannia exigua TaxID=604196 RepID=A0AAD4DHP7_9FUNG|nr:hypothetical protein BGZ95_007009 [Linnemannia exigua]
MAAVKELERLSVPATLGSGFSPSSPAPLSATSATTDSSHHTTCRHNNNSNGSNHNRLSVLTRSVSVRSSIASSRRSATSIKSHVSTFQNSAGWLPTIIAFGVVSLLSSLSSLFICEAMTEVPGNEHFQSNVEFNNLVECFFGRRYHLLVQIICFLAMQTTNIASIAQLASASPFSGVMIMTAGVLLALSMILPLALLKLSENIWLQLASFILILLIVTQWIVTFITHGLDTSLVPVIGEDISQTFGTILFNYAFITTIPSWANAKQPNVSIHKTVSWSVGITTSIYILVAILGGMAYQIPSNSSLIQAISSSPDVTILSQITGYTFPIAALITSIPINIIVIRYNLIQSGACSYMWSNILAGFLPWLVAIPCMTGAGLTTVINWSSLFLVSTANFIIPFILYIYSKRHREKLNKLPIIEMEQQARLSREMSRSSFSGHSRRNTSVSGSIRRRLTGSSFQYGSQSHLDLAIGPTTGIAAATVIPLSVGIGGSGVLHHSSSEENLNVESIRYGSRRRHHSHQNAGLGSSSTGDIGELVSGPYFSFSRDGEVFERESSSGHILEPSDPRSQSSSTIHRPSGPTVILHDPGTERAQRKVLPRRVSHKDKILSMISDKHKRAVEKQTKMIQDEQTSKPVPPMILLSQSTAPEPEDDDQTSSIDLGLYSQENGSYEAEKYSEKDIVGESKDISEANSNLSAALKKLNRKSSIISPHQQQPSTRSTLTLPPLSPPIRVTPPMTEIRGDSRPVIQHFERPEQHALEPSPTFSPPRSPSSPLSAFKRSPSSSPGRSSPGSNQEATSSRPPASPGFGNSRDSLKPEATLTDTARLSPGAGSTSSSGGLASAFNFQLHHSPSTPDSSSSVHSLDRRVSFSDESRGIISPTEHERKTSFGDESRRSGRTLASALSSASGRLGVSPSSSPGSRDVRTPSHDWRAPLLEDHEEVDEDEREDESDSRDETLGPELYLAKTEQSQAFGSILESKPGSGSDFDGQRSEARRSSLCRMAAAFVSQPGSFSILTAPASPPLAPGKTDEGRDAKSVRVPTLTFTAQDTVDRPQGLDPTQGVTKHSVTAPSLSPSGPPTFLPAQPVAKRAHGRTVSASAEIMDRSPRSQRPTLRTQSTQSLKDVQQHKQGRLAAPESASSFSIHLTPPSPSLLPNAQFEATTPPSEEARDSVRPLTSSAVQPSPQPRTAPLHHRTSFNGRNNHRHSVAAPFQGGNNYSIPGFSPYPQTSPHHPPSPGSSSAADQVLTPAQGLGSSWFNRHHHSRNPSRSTMTSIGIPYSTGSMPPSPCPTSSELVIGGGLGVGLGAGIVGAGKRSEEYFHDATTTTSGSMTMAPQHTTTTTTGTASGGTTVAEMSGVAEFERTEARLHESNFHLPLYSIGGGLGFDARWSLRAIPDWFPLSSTKVAWTSLTILVLAIGSTIVYDFIQLARGNDPVGGS